ncbi:response regulator transcription factor [Myroides fluvii]|uniref:response regulator transcription factor n=1 Tax=Myroides fluvii TaxID=2572594 RepID=UPI00131D435B|nr:response regulator transcription factor [Myroides fluvii]
MPIYLSICESDIHFKNLLIEHVDRALNLELIDYYSNGFELINRLQHKQNNFLLIDVFTPIMTGIEAVKILQKKQNKTPIIMYTHVYQADIEEQLGSYKHVYYCQKNSQIIFKILTALLQENISFYKQHLEQWKTHDKEFNDYTPREALVYTPSSTELKIINYACKGLTNKEIGEKVHLSGRTIESHIKKLINKFSVQNKIQLITYCVEHHLHLYN